MPKAKVNDREVEFEKGMTVLQVCELAGEEIPRFCYHERLSIAGNCRMCLVEVKGGPPKPVASCAMPASEGQVIYTDTPMVKKAREGVMEFLLINHPLDCPICDQGGECDLQDQSMAYGRAGNRFQENKRGVKDKYMGPLVKTVMTRCIHCTRCIRFMDDIAGVEVMGATGRGEDMEVGTFIEQGINSELSGNIIDLCPVGALTSKPYEFKARSWELRKTESIDVLDAVGSNIRVDARGNEVMRILPRLHEDINEEWISDKTRFACDGLKVQRIDQPYVRKEGKLQPATWEEAYDVISKRFKKLKGNQIAAIAGDMADAESMFLLKKTMQEFGSPNYDCRQDGAKLDADARAGYLFNTTIAGIEQADACLLIGTNPRVEASLVNARLRKRWLKGKFPVASIGAEAKLTYDVKNLGDDIEILFGFIQGSHPFSRVMKEAQRPIVIVGQGVYAREDGAAILETIHEMCEKTGVVKDGGVAKDGWNGFNVLHTAASRVGGLELGFVPEKDGRDVEGILEGAEDGSIKAVYLLGADELDMARLKKAFVVYQGHHGDAGASHADVVLPGAAYTEKEGTFVNLEGRMQRTKRAAFAPGEAKEDWKILSDLATVMGWWIGYENLAEVQVALAKESKVFAVEDTILPAKWEKFGKKGRLLKTPIAETIENFYMTDAISRASRTMAKCTEEFINGRKKKEAA